MSAATTSQSGLLELLVCKDQTVDYIGDGFALSWTGFPDTASWGSPRLEDVDLGDWECKPIPGPLPHEAGLWLLRWEWVKAVDDEGFDSARYADTCEWRRPTMADLVRLGVLPELQGGAA